MKTAIQAATLVAVCAMFSFATGHVVASPNKPTPKLKQIAQTGLKCPKCSAKVNPDWRFCDKCGNPLTIKPADTNSAPSTAKGILGAPEMKAMLVSLGHELKTLNDKAGEEKYEFLITKGGYDVPIAAEISGSKNYVWLTVFLGPAPTSDKAPASKFEAFLKANHDVQPCQFYITSKGSLMLAIPMDNRGLTNAIMKRSIDRIVDATVDNASLWVG